MNLRDRCQATCDKIQRDAIMRQGSPVETLMAFVIAELASEWQPIADARRDGTHILACIGPYSEHWTFDQRPPAVIHYWENPGEEGFYLSSGGSPDEQPYPATHWKPLDNPPA